MSRLSWVMGKCHRSNGKTPDIRPEPEWRAERVMAAERMARKPKSLAGDKLHRLADSYRPKASG